MRPASHQTLMMGTQMVPETSVTFNKLTRLITREGFISLAVVEASHPTTGYQLENRWKVDVPGGTKENQETYSVMTVHYNYH
jgi:hypothetical protein